MITPLFKEYPKRVIVSCYCPLNQWNARSVPNENLCGLCTRWQKFFDDEYEIVARGQPGDKHIEQ